MASHVLLDSYEFEVDSSVVFSLVLGLEEFYLSDFFEVFDMGSTVGLLVYAGYLYDA